MTTLRDIAYRYEELPLGVFWTDEWSVPESELWASVVGYDRMTLLGNTYFYSTEVYRNKTIKSLIETVLTDGGVLAYEIDSELESVIIPYAYFEQVTHREALRLLVESFAGQAYCDRNGVVIVEYGKSASEPMATLTEDDWYSKDNPQNWRSVFNVVSVSTNPLHPDTPKSVYEDLDDIAIDNDEIQQRMVYYDTAPCIDATATIQGNATLEDAEYYSWGALATVKGTSNGNYKIEITATPLVVRNRQQSTATDSKSIRENGRLTFSLNDNPYVQTLPQAQLLAQKILASTKETRRDVELDWRGDVGIGLGDVIETTDRYDTSEYEVISIKTEYDGTLKQITRGRKT